MIIDSDVIIEVLRGNRRTTVWLSSQAAAGIRVKYSPVTRAEIRAGARPKERASISRLFEAMSVVPIEAATGDIAGDQLARFSSSHGVQMGDALIAAAAIEHDEDLATFNAGHFPGVSAVITPDR